MGNNSVTSFSGRRITLVVLGFVLLVTIVVAGLLVDFLNKQELVRKDQQLQDAQFWLIHRLM